jgi:hypothetical protein
MVISRPLAALLALLIAVAAPATEKPVAVVGAVEATAKVERLRTKISTLGQCPSLDLDSVLIFPLFGAMLIETSNLGYGAGLTCPVLLPVSLVHGTGRGVSPCLVAERDLLIRGLGLATMHA